MTPEELLEHTEFFRDLPAPLRKRIAAKGKMISFARNDFIFHQGDEGLAFYSVAKGFVKLVKFSPDGKEVMVRLAKPHDTFAEVILFENKEYPVTAVAGDDAELFSLHRSAFQELLLDEDFRNGFFAMLMNRMRYLAERIVYVSAYDVEERFFRFLIERYGKKESYEISMPKKDIAAAMGTIPETFSRLMMRLKKRKIITWEGDILTVSSGYWNSADYEE
ncbi:MAG: Crp/Fnr family transcriptional regulator [Spirochaetota bacterium]